MRYAKIAHPKNPYTVVLSLGEIEMIDWLAQYPQAVEITKDEHDAVEETQDEELIDILDWYPLY
jgi:hypothetical protein